MLAEKHTREHQKVMQWKALENMKINQFFLLFFHVKHRMMCIIVSGQIFSSNESRRCMEFWKIEMSAINALLTHIRFRTRYNMLCNQNVHICVCMRGDELQTLHLQVCTSLVNVQFHFQKKNQLYIHSCWYNNVVRVIESMSSTFIASHSWNVYTDEMLL